MNVQMHFPTQFCEATFRTFRKKTTVDELTSKLCFLQQNLYKKCKKYTLNVPNLTACYQSPKHTARFNQSHTFTCFS